MPPTATGETLNFKTMTLKFSDGIQVDTSGPLRTLQLTDGWYVVGEGKLIPVKDEKESVEEIMRMTGNAQDRLIKQIEKLKKLVEDAHEHGFENGKLWSKPEEWVSLDESWEEFKKKWSI